jgi:hypothetical protein
MRSAGRLDGSADLPEDLVGLGFQDMRRGGHTRGVERGAPVEERGGGVGLVVPEPGVLQPVADDVPGGVPPARHIVLTVSNIRSIFPRPRGWPWRENTSRIFRSAATASMCAEVKSEPWSV